ncbi:hypothetical protein [Levilactobacillus brevis]|uniref:hypothetical protein n=1 Tax=Levilactobacillus brevis TaxID=1580 RepID=UPI001BDF3E5F|nr:hypothetical protein [Levilactobacillus brevis]
MTTVRHKLFLMGASLMLVSGGVITIAVLPVQAATITANVKQGEKVGSVEMPLYAGDYQGWSTTCLLGIKGTTVVNK